MKLEKEIIWNRVTKTQKDEYYIYVDIIHSVFGKQYIICITTEIRYRLRVYGGKISLGRRNIIDSSGWARRREWKGRVKWGRERRDSGGNMGKES